jgi:ABC-type glycerol-3-phosphate transport system substrate-binding protein
VNLGVWAKGLFDPICSWRGGKILGLPNQTGGNWPVMPYNREIFQKNGVPEPPTSWTDSKWNAQAFLDALQKTTKTGPDGKIATYGINAPGPGVYTVNWSISWKAKWVTEDFKTVVCDSPELTEAMQYLVDLTGRYKVAATGPMMTEAFGDANAQNNFLNGKLAMFQGAGGSTFAMAQAVAQRNLPIAYAPLPFFKQPNAANNVDDNGIPTGAKHPEEAWAYIKWQSETPNWAISRGNFPARPEHVEAWAKELYPGDLATKMRLDVYRDSLKNVAGLDPIFLIPPYRQMQGDIIAPAVAKMLAGTAGVPAALKEIKAPLQTLIPASLP